jgi:hypothetical protein
MTAVLPSIVASVGQCAFRKSLVHVLWATQTSAPPAESGVIL